MKKIIVAFVLFCSIGINAQNDTSRFFSAYNYESLTVSTVAIGFSASLINPGPSSGYRAQLASFTLSGCRIRYRLDGLVNPTATEGQTLEVGSDVSVFNYTNLTQIRFIRDTSCSVNGILKTTYYR